MVDAVLFELDAAEEVHIRGHQFHVLELKVDAAFSEDFLCGIEQFRGLLELADAVAPTGPQAELEEANWNLRRRNGIDDPNEGLHAGDLAPDIFTKDGGLAIG